MDNKKVGSFIASLRKEKSLTQQELADELNVTNKAVSKWETGQGYPEITIIPVLAEILWVTTSELLNGELSIQKTNDKEIATTIINETAQYYGRATIKKGNIAILIILIVSILSSFVCLLCNYLINKTFNWSLYPLGALIVLWCVIISILKVKRFKIMASLVVFTVMGILYLFLIEYLVPVKGWVIPLALPIAILCISILGIVLFLFIHTKIYKLYSVAITVLLFGVVVNVGINRIIKEFFNKAIANDVSMFTTLLASIFLSLVLISIGYIRKRQSKAWRED